MEHSAVECADSSFFVVDLLDGIEYSLVVCIFIVGLELFLDLKACYDEVEGVCKEL